jgi:hypothetical protein
MKGLKCAILALAITLQLCLCDDTSDSPLISVFENEISDNATILSQRNKPLLSTGNDLWDGLIRDCLKKPTFSCIQKNVFTFLDSTLGLKDVNVTNRVQLTQNSVEYQLPDKQQPDDDENEIFSQGRCE